jgi:hypothetical protein
MISLVDGAAAAHTIASLRAACEMMVTAAGRIDGVSVSGVLPDAEDAAVPILSLAQRLASEHGLAVNVTVDDGRFVVQFRRGLQRNGRSMSEAG